MVKTIVRLQWKNLEVTHIQQGFTIFDVNVEDDEPNRNIYPKNIQKEKNNYN